MQFEEVKELIAIFEKTDLNDMELQLDNAVVRLNRGKGVPAMPPVPPVPGQLQAYGQGQEAVFMAGNIQPSANKAFPAGDGFSKEEINNLGKPGTEEKDNTGSGKFIKAPIVGTFYQSASPEKPPYVNVGDTVSKGDIVCIIEAMKFMNEVASEENGKIAEILVEDGEFVEFGEPLFRIE